MRALHRQLRFLFAVLLMMALATPCYAMVAPQINLVASWSDFLVRYHSEDDPDAFREYASRQPLTCTASTVLGGTQGYVTLTALDGIRVAPGAVLTVDNPNLLLMGAPPFITVERGGTLRILRWNEMMTDGSMPTAGMIQVEAGGTLQVADKLAIPAGMVTRMADTPPNTMLPPSLEPEPEPEPEPIPIESLHEPTPQVESVKGKSSVETVLPNTVLVRLSHGEKDLALAVQWDLSGVPFNTPGTYTVYGDFIPDGLTFKGVSNPKGLRPVVSLTILASTPMRDLVWTIKEPVSNGSALFRLAFSSLPEGVEHLYLQRSTDGVHWSRCASDNRPQDTDLLADVTTRSGTSFLTSRQSTENAGFYLRLEVVGSSREGTSNILYIHPLADGEDGRSEGNRSGIQGVFNREGQKEPAPAPEAAKESESPQEELPQQVESHKAEPNEVPTEQEAVLNESTSGWSGAYFRQGENMEPLDQETSFSGSTSGWSGSYHMQGDNLELTENPPLIEGEPAEEAVPETPQPSPYAATTPEEVDASQSILDTDLPTVAEPLAVERNSSAPQNDGDTNGFVAAATLAVCLFSAAGLFLRHKYLMKRKS